MINSAKLLPERIITGFAHLLWVVLFTMLLMDIKPEELYNYLLELNTGYVALLASFIIGLSYYFGNLSDWFIILIISYYMKIFKKEAKPLSKIKSKLENNKDTLQELRNIYIDKSFHRSIFIAGLFIILSSILLDGKWNEYKNFFTIISVGGFIEIITVITMNHLRNLYSSQWEKIKTSK